MKIMTALILGLIVVLGTVLYFAIQHDVKYSANCQALGGYMVVASNGLMCIRKDVFIGVK
jgi:hypothetical protein